MKPKASSQREKRNGNRTGAAQEVSSRTAKIWVGAVVFILLCCIPLAVRVWNFRNGTVNGWLSNQPVLGQSTLNSGMVSDFEHVFGISPQLSAEFERKLTDGGHASQAEMARREKVFSMYIQEHSADFNADPASAIRVALKDPASFGLVVFPSPTGP